MQIKVHSPLHIVEKGTRGRTPGPEGFTLESKREIIDHRGRRSQGRGIVVSFIYMYVQLEH